MTDLDETALAAARAIPHATLAERITAYLAATETATLDRLAEPSDAVVEG